MKVEVICHMLMSIDGKVTGSFLNDEKCSLAIDKYYEINRKLGKDAIALGRVTMEESFTKGYYPSLDRYKGIKVEKVDYVNSKHDFYMIAFDRYGKLGYLENKIKDEDEGYNNSYIIEVLLESVSSSYLAYLRDLGISYIFAGKDELDISLALEKLNNLFGIKKIILEGGSIINGAFFKEDLIDELSLVIPPLVASKDDKPLFYQSENKSFYLVENEINKNYIYLRYRKS